MITIGKIIKRNMLRAARSGGAWAYGLIFMLIFLSLSAIALDGNMSALRGLGVALIWLAITFAALMCADRAISDDLQDGTTGQLWLSGFSYMDQAITAILSFSLINLLPLILTVPLWSLLFDLNKVTVMGAFISLLIALPAIASFTVLAGALTGGRGKGSFLAIFISAPLLVPILIFGIAASEAFVISGWSAVELRILLGLSLLALALSIPAIAASLSANTDR